MSGAAGTTGAAPVAEHYELGTEEFCSNPYPRWNQMRELGPIVHWPDADAFVVVGFDAAREVLADVEHFSPSRRFSNNAAPPPPEDSRLGRMERSGLFHLVPDDHLRVRRLINPAFTPRGVEALRPFLAERARQILAPLEAGATLDLAPLASELPVEVMATYLGLDNDAMDWLVSHTHSIFALSNPLSPPEVLAGIEADLVELAEVLTEEFASRRTAPRGDLLSTLVAATEDGDRLDDDELFSLVVALLMAGSETTTNLLTLGTLALVQHPDAYATLRADPTRIRSAIDEMLRWSYIGFMVARFAITDTEVSGVHVHAGSLMMIAVGAALHDPSVVDRPEVFDLDRTRQPALAFGTGVRHCLGTGLARATGEEFFDALASLPGPVELDGGDDAVVWNLHPVLRGLASLPLTLGAD